MGIYPHWLTNLADVIRIEGLENGDTSLLHEATIYMRTKFSENRIEKKCN